MPEPGLMPGGGWEGDREPRVCPPPPGPLSSQVRACLPSGFPYAPQAMPWGEQSRDFPAHSFWQQPGSGVLSQLLPPHPPSRAGPSSPHPGARHQGLVPAQMPLQLFQPSAPPPPPSPVWVLLTPTPDPMPDAPWTASRKFPLPQRWPGESGELGAAGPTQKGAGIVGEKRSGGLGGTPDCGLASKAKPSH